MSRTVQLVDEAPATLGAFFYEQAEVLLMIDCCNIRVNNRTVNKWSKMLHRSGGYFVGKI